MADEAAARLGPNDPLARFLAEERDRSYSGTVIFLDSIPTGAESRAAFIQLLDAATVEVTRRNVFAGVGRSRVDTTIRAFRQWLAASPLAAG